MNNDTRPTVEQVVRAFEQTGSIKGASRHLGVPYSTLKGWRDRDPHLKYVTDKATTRYKAPENKLEHSDTTRNSFHLDRERDVYVFHLASRQGPFEVSGETWRNICWDYPKSGGDLTRGQISLKYDIPRPVLEILLRTYGLYKHDPERANEDIQEATEEDLEEMRQETLEKKKLSYLVKLEKKEHDDLKKEVVELRAYKANRQSAESRLEEAAERVFSRTGPASTSASVDAVMPSAGGPLCGERYKVHAPIADLHGGMLAWARETWGGNWDTHIAASTDVLHARAVARFVLSLGGKCEELWSTNLGDHFNGLDLATEAGTPQEQDGRPFHVWEKMFQAAVVKIEVLRRVTDHLRVRYVPGNHDHMHVQFFFHSLMQRFLNTEDVELVAHPRWQESFRIARSLHVLDHGKGLPDNLATDKAQNAAKRVARNVGGEDFYNARFLYFYVGHLHTESSAMDDNLKMYRLPAASDQTDWENKMRFSAEPAARMWTLDSMGRPDIERPVYFEGEETGRRTA